MFHDFDEQWAGRNHDDHPAEHTETPSHELDPLHVRLLADGAAWSATHAQAEAVVRLADHVRILTASAHEAAPTHSADSRPAQPAPSMLLRAAQPAQTLPDHTRAPGTSRWGVLPALAAAVVVVALLAGVLTTLTNSRNTHGVSTALHDATSTAQPTLPTPRPTFGPPSGDWTTSPGLRAQIAPPIVEPGDPRVIYESISGGQALRRSHDGGVTWQSVATPKLVSANISTPTTVGVSAVSATESDVLVLSLTAMLNTADATLCPDGSSVAYAPLHGALVANGFASCTESFFSRDGGDHWNHVQVPQGYSNPVGLSGWKSMPVQNGQLYARVEDRARRGEPLYPAGIRIVTSSDGISWQLADLSLASQVQNICDLLAAPTGTLLFALTASQNCFLATSDSTFQYQVWRSDDAGAHWTRASTVAAWHTYFVGITPTYGGGAPLLYLDTIEQGHPDVLHTYASSDGGSSWQPAPTAGIPPQDAPIVRVTGQLRDGSIVEACVNTATENMATSNTTAPHTLTFFAWRSGDSAWRQVAPPLRVYTYNSGFLATSVPGGSDQLWISAPDGGTGSSTPITYSLHTFSL